MVDSRLSVAEATYYASRVNVLISKLGGLLKFYSDPSNVHSLNFRKPLKLARVTKIAEYPIVVYTHGYNGVLSFTPYSIVKQLPRSAFVDGQPDAIAVKVKGPSDVPDKYYATAVAYRAKNKSVKMILQKPIITLRTKNGKNSDNDKNL